MNERCTLGLWQRKLCALTLSAMNKIYSIKLFIVFHFWDRKNKVIVAMRTKIQCTKFHHAIGILQQIFHCKVDAVASCSTDFDVGVLSQKCTLKSSPEHSAAHVARNLRQNHQHRTATIFTGPLNANQRRIMEIFPELKICNSYTKVFCVLFVLFFLLLWKPHAQAHNQRTIQSKHTTDDFMHTVFTKKNEWFFIRKKYKSNKRRKISTVFGLWLFLPFAEAHASLTHFFSSSLYSCWFFSVHNALFT